MKIKIATLVLTRRCNLHCDYCRFSGDIDYMLQPQEYPNGKYYFENERPPEFWIDMISRMVKHNKDIFFILFGGEPFLYKGLPKVVKYLKDKDANYTIISNCSDTIKPLMEDLFDKVGKIKGFTASIDPGFWIPEILDDDEIYKSNRGFDMLVRLKHNNLVDDPVAEITVDRNNIVHLEETVKRLSDIGIYSDITVLDIAKNNYYDFSAVTNPETLVPKNSETMAIFEKLRDSDYKIHMKDTLLMSIYGILPANLDCKLGKNNLHNVTIECDGSMRCCGRIRGRYAPDYLATELFNEDGSDAMTKFDIEEAIEEDKAVLCQGCNHTCQCITLVGTGKEINMH